MDYNFEDYHTTQWVDDTAFNRALKFAVEKYDHIEMNKMAAYYIYLMRFGGVDQTVKNAMLTTEGPATDDANSTLPSLWYFINYDNDTILGVKMMDVLFLTHMLHVKHLMVLDMFMLVVNQLFGITLRLMNSLWQK